MSVGSQRYADGKSVHQDVGKQVKRGYRRTSSFSARSLISSMAIRTSRERCSRYRILFSVKHEKDREEWNG